MIQVILKLSLLQKNKLKNRNLMIAVMKVSRLFKTKERL